MTTLRHVVVIVAGCSACGSGVDLEGRVRREPITHASPEPEAPAVVALIAPGGALRCTGTLVAPRVVLTAAHCGITAENARGFCARFGPVASGDASAIAVAHAASHPAFDPATLENDVAVLRLSRDASEAPARLLEDPFERFAPGTPLRVVGFGLDARGGTAGTKRSGTSALTAVAASTFTVAPAPSQPCSLDSGGPAFVAVGGVERLAGIVSHGDASCSSGATLSRADVHREEFIRPYVDAARSFPEEASTCGAAMEPVAGGCSAAPARAGGWVACLLVLGALAGLRRGRGASRREP